MAENDRAGFFFFLICDEHFLKRMRGTKFAGNEIPHGNTRIRTAQNFKKQIRIVLVSFLTTIQQPYAF